MKKTGNKKKMNRPSKLPKPTRKISAQDVANYFLNQVDEDEGSDPLSNLKIQKLVYYAQGYHLALFGKPLFDEEIEAWKHGPVVPSLYQKFKHFGAGPIDRPKSLNDSLFKPEVRDLLDQVFAYYDQYSATKLRNMTHSEPPWKNSYREDTGGLVIPKKSLMEFFKTQIES